MAFLQFRSLLHLSRFVVIFSMLGASAAVFMLLGKTVDVATGKPEVRLTLNTTSPNLYPALHDLAAGMQDGFGGKVHRPERGPLPAWHAAQGAFAVVADPQTPLLRYQEPNTWKRLALLYLGASNDYLSLAWVAFFGVGSWLLWQLLLDVKPGTPFTMANAHRLRSLGLWIIGPIYLGQTLSYLAIRMLVPAFRAPGLVEPLSHYVRLNTEASLPGWEIGLMLLIIAAVYRRGVELSQEAELVI